MSKANGRRAGACVEHRDGFTIANMTDIQRSLEQVRARIAEAALRAGRAPSEITLVAVSKTYPAEAVLEAMAAGQVDFGENRVEEAAPKIEAVAGRQKSEYRIQNTEPKWHL